jgi:hypothetical protein
VSETPTNLPPAGWYADPYGHPVTRWWDGTQWTQHTTPNAEPAAPAAAEQPAQQQTQPYGSANGQADGYQNTGYNDAVAQAAQQAAQQAEAQQAAQQLAAQQAAQQLAAQQAAQQAAAQLAAQQAAERQAAEQQSTAQQLFGQYQPTQQDPAQQTPSYESPAAYTPPSAEVPADTGAPTQNFVTPSYGAPQYEAPASSAPATPAQESEPFSFFGNVAATPDSAGSYGQPGTTEQPYGGPANEDFAFFTSPQSNQTWDDEDELPRNGAATAGLTLGILSFFLPLLPALLGLVFSASGLAKAKKLADEGFEPIGRGKAVAGLVLSAVSAIAVALAAVFFLPGFLAALQSETTTIEDTNGVGLNERGNIAMIIGQPGELTSLATGQPAVQFSVTEIGLEVTCTNDATPENGQFVAVTMQLTTATDYLDVMSANEPMLVSWQDWTGYSTDGIPVEVSGAGADCLPDQSFPAGLPAGETTTGVIVLDVTPETTSVSWTPQFAVGIAEQLSSWEWELIPL